MNKSNYMTSEEKIKEIQRFIKTTICPVEFNDGTKAYLPLDSISGDGLAVKVKTFIRENKIEHPYPYKVLGFTTEKEHLGND